MRSTRDVRSLFLGVGDQATSQQARFSQANAMAGRVLRRERTTRLEPSDRSRTMIFKCASSPKMILLGGIALIAVYLLGVGTLFHDFTSAKVPPQRANAAVTA